MGAYSRPTGTSFCSNRVKSMQLYKRSPIWEIWKKETDEGEWGETKRELCYCSSAVMQRSWRLGTNLPQVILFSLVTREDFPCGRLPLFLALFQVKSLVGTVERCSNLFSLLLFSLSLSLIICLADIVEVFKLLSVYLWWTAVGPTSFAALHISNFVLLLLLIPSQLMKAGKSRKVGEFELNKRIERWAIKSPGQSNYNLSERTDWKVVVTS